jgi:hypothetical protein
MVVMNEVVNTLIIEKLRVRKFRRGIRLSAFCRPCPHYSIVLLRTAIEGHSACHDGEAPKESNILSIPGVLSSTIQEERFVHFRIVISGSFQV